MTQAKKAVVSMLFIAVTITTAAFAQTTGIDTTQKVSAMDSTAAVQAGPVPAVVPSAQQAQLTPQEQCLLDQKQEEVLDPTPMLKGEQKSAVIAQALEVSGISFATIIVVMGAFGILTSLFGRFFPGEEE